MRSIFYADGNDQKLKSGPHPLFIPNIPFFHDSIIPLATYGQPPPLWGEIKAWCSGPGSFTLPTAGM
jgi:hypothetical protein